MTAEKTSAWGAMSAARIEQDIYWNRHVMNSSRGPVQVARCAARLERLETMRAQLKEQTK